MNKIYLSNHQIVMNYDLAYPKNRDALLKGQAFHVLIQYYISQQTNEEILNYLTQDGKLSHEESAKEFAKFLRQLSIFELNEIDSPYAKNAETLLEVIEQVYKFWRTPSRFGFMKRPRWIWCEYPCCLRFWSK